jgi:hypothetical protein
VSVPEVDMAPVPTERERMLELAWRIRSMIERGETIGADFAWCAMQLADLVAAQDEEVAA